MDFNTYKTSHETHLDLPSKPCIVQHSKHNRHDGVLETKRLFCAVRPQETNCPFFIRGCFSSHSWHLLPQRSLPEMAGLWWGHYLTSRSGACKCGHKATSGAPISLWSWLPAFPPLQNPLHVLFLHPAHMSSASLPCPLLWSSQCFRERMFVFVC